MVSIHDIQQALNREPHEARPFVPEPNHAAVAMMFAGSGRKLELCFIRRAERQGDPWSGHVAFPGGRASPGDPTPAAVAERETMEEVGIRLRPEHRIGHLPELPVRRDDLKWSMTLSPFLYHVGPERLPHRANAMEVAEVFWVPVPHLFDEATTTTYDFVRNGEALSFPGVAAGSNIIWGLTLRVLGVFAERLQRPFPALPDYMHP